MCHGEMSAVSKMLMMSKSRQNSRKILKRIYDLAFLESDAFKISLEFSRTFLKLYVRFVTKTCIPTAHLASNVFLNLSLKVIDSVYYILSK